jgi:phosphoadenosine phosphosulfate reductase
LLSIGINRRGLKADFSGTTICMMPSVEVGSKYDEELLASASTIDSGYNSDATENTREIIFTSTHLNFLNEQLSAMEPEEILRWCLVSLPNLYQTTALGLTGAK